MKLIITELRYKNIRDFRDFRIKLTNKNGTAPHISLIQMPNGTGKTTTISLIQYALFGKEWRLPREVRKFEPQSFTAENGSFEMLYLVDGEKHSIKLDFEYEIGKAKYSTSSPTSGGYEKGHNLPRQIRSLMTEEFTKLFIFDGELASDLFNSQKTKAEGAIRSVFYLDRLLSLEKRIDEALKSKLSSTKKTKVKEASMLKSLEKELSKLKRDKETMLHHVNHLKEDKERVTSDLLSLESQLQSLVQLDSNFKEEYDLINEQISNKGSEIVDNTNKLLHTLRNPANWSKKIRINLDSLNDNMYKLRLPRTASREFFIELSQSATCVCGEPLNDIHREHIKKISETYLDDDATTVMNSIKHSIRNLSSLDNPKPLFE